MTVPGFIKLGELSVALLLELFDLASLPASPGVKLSLAQPSSFLKTEVNVRVEIFLLG